jgi:hypothetical protein
MQKMPIREASSPDRSGKQVAEVFDIRERSGASEFLGYGEVSAEGEVRALVVDGHEVEAVDADGVALAEEFDTGLHTHSSESVWEVQESLKRWGRRPIDVLHQRGVLGPHCVVAHGVWLDDREIQAKTQQRLRSLGRIAGADSYLDLFLVTHRHCRVLERLTVEALGLIPRRPQHWTVVEVEDRDAPRA